MRLALIVNPIASSVTRRGLVVIQKALAADHELEVFETTRKGQAIRLARGAARDGADVVVSLGGDGTINEVANGVIGADCCAIAPLPGGSTNVFAQAVGYPNDAIEATGVLLDALAHGSRRPASVGMANDRLFLFHAGAGFDAAVVARVEQRGSLKRYLGHPLFIASTFGAWVSALRGGETRFEVEADDGRTIDGAVLAVAQNCAPYTFLGGHPLHLAPEADLDRPLSISGLTSLGPQLLPRMLWVAARRTGFGDRGSFRHWADVTGATIRSERPFGYQLDGEAMEPVTELRLDHRPDALRLVTPTPTRTRTTREHTDER